MKTPLIGQAYAARSNVLACDRLVNMYIESAPSDAREPAMLKRFPGYRQYAEAIASTPSRNLYVSSTGKCYAFVGNMVYYVVGGTYLATTGTLVTSSGHIGVTDNGSELFIVDGTAGYTLDLITGLITQITDPDFPNGAVVAMYMDTYFMTNVPNSFTFQWSAQNDGQAWDALDFASAEGSPDYITAGIIVNREIWWFGPVSKEVFYSTGTGTVFERVTGGFTDQGCIAYRALVQADNTCFWLGQDKNGSAMIYRGRGYTASRVSTHAVEWQIASYSTITDCIAWAMQMDGHTFIIFTFPSAGKCWCFDISSNAWNELGSLQEDGTYGLYRPCFHVYFEGKHLVGDTREGRISEMSMTVYDELGSIQKCLRAWTQPNQEKREQRFKKLEIDCSMGDGLISGQGSNPLLMLRYSNDNGKTWPCSQTASIGAMGEYSNLCRFWDLGSARVRVWEMSITDPVPFAVVGAYLDGEVLNA